MQTLGWVLAIFLGAAAGLMFWYGDTEVANRKVATQHRLVEQQNALALLQTSVEAQEKSTAAAKLARAEAEAKRIAAEKDKDEVAAKIDGLKHATTATTSKKGKIDDLTSEIMDLKGKLADALGK